VAFAFFGAIVEIAPRMRPASFNLDRVMEQVQKPAAKD